MKKIFIIFVFSICFTVQSIAAGYSILPHSNPSEFIKAVREHEDEYCEVLEEEIDGDFEVYTYILDFQIISQISGKEYVATVTGLADDPLGVQNKIEEAKKVIERKEKNHDFASKDHNHLSSS